MLTIDPARCLAADSASPLESSRPSRRSDFAQRSFDCLASACLIVLALPAIVLAILAVRLTSRGPAIYKQVRLGRYGRPFLIYKIRSMTHECERKSGVQWSSKHDSRVTPVGRILRKTHLDELPQLINILCGEMSLVGPRPERPEIVSVLDHSIPNYRHRLAVRPGLTGLAQVQLPPDTDLNSVRRKLRYDLHYISTSSVWMDVRLVFATGVHVLGIPFAVSRALIGLPGEPEVEPERRAAVEPAMPSSSVESAPAPSSHNLHDVGIEAARA